jgi:hypothetical protein
MIFHIDEDSACGHLDHEAGRRRLGGRWTGVPWGLVVRLDLASRVEQHQSCQWQHGHQLRLPRGNTCWSFQQKTEVAADAGVALRLQAAHPLGCRSALPLTAPHH